MMGNDMETIAEFIEKAEAALDEPDYEKAREMIREASEMGNRLGFSGKGEELGKDDPTGV
jgi:mevalonate kinase